MAERDPAALWMISARIEVPVMEAAVDYTRREGKSNAGKM